jgi:hypothetical protein
MKLRTAWKVYRWTRTTLRVTKPLWRPAALALAGTIVESVIRRRGRKTPHHAAAVRFVRSTDPLLWRRLGWRKVRQRR